MLDRTKAPDFHSLKIPNLVKPEINRLANGIEIAYYLSEDQNLVSLELIFPAKSLDSATRQKELYAFKMLMEGTKSKTSKQLADSVSFLGASFEISHSADFETISISCLSRVLPEMLLILSEIWNDSIFPEKEWKTMKETTLQKNNVNLQKTSYLAGKLLRQTLFGSQLDYGYSIESEFVESLNVYDFISTFGAIKNTGPALVLVSGRIDEKANQFLVHWLGTFEGCNSCNRDQIDLPEGSSGVLWDVRPESQQASVRIGTSTINSLHSDSSLLNLVLEIYGGYFGSRLMTNIREEKGWTYGIFAQRVPNLRAPYWVIGSDINGEKALETVAEINKEADILRNELVPEDELELVKNYMLGQFLSSITNCYGLADRYKSMWMNGQSFERVASNLITIQEASSIQVREIAEKYLHPESAIVALSGKKTDSSE